MIDFTMSGKTVYIVFCNCHDETNIESIFSTEDRAKAEVENLKIKNKKRIYNYYDYDQYIIDDTRKNDE